MNRNLAQLHEVFLKKERLIIGLMSGTSLDGLDIALCRLRNKGLDTEVQLIEFETVSYDEGFKNEIRKIFSKRTVDLEKVCLMNDLTGSLQAGLILDALRRWGVESSQIDCIASHGQSIYHAPMRLHKLQGFPNATLQIGDGDHIARKTGILTLSDFRQKHIAAGGEGAPLALYGDYILFTSNQENRILLNIGGIANFTYLPASGDSSKIECSDTGPGNTLIDNLVQTNFGLPFDRDGLIAEKGQVNDDLLYAMLAHPFFSEPLPKTIGPELFNLDFIAQAKIAAGITHLSPEDLIATTTRLTAQTIFYALEPYKNCLFTIYASGGGARNPAITKHIKSLLPNIELKGTADLGIDPDAKEAILFAILANETLSDSQLTIGGQPAVTMGKISLPY